MTYEEARGLALLVSAEQVEAINGLLPPETRVTAFTVDGQSYLGADLLTDCGPNGTYEAATTVLQGLTIVPFPTIPTPSEE